MTPTPGPAAEPPSHALRRMLGDIDIYLFDQILRGRFDGRRRVLDAGCGGARNLSWFLANGYDVLAVDGEPAAVDATRALFRRLAPHLPPTQVLLSPLDALPCEDASMDAVISSAVLHFAEDDRQFERMLRELWRVLKVGGLLFARLASSIGLEQVLPRTVGRVHLPDGSDRYVVSEATLLQWTDRLGGELLDPIKTTNVQGLRCMTTWVVRKGRA